MAIWLKRGAGVLGLGVVAGAVTMGVAARRWRSATERLAHRLTNRTVGGDGSVSFAVLGDLPAPVQRYFRTVLHEGRPLIRGGRISQAGEFRAQESGDVEAGWQPFDATHVFTVEPPGFVWDARIRMTRFVSMRVRDAYVAGHASMRGALLAIVPIVNAADTPELRQGALQRYLAESVWYPTALLPSETMHWSPIDETHSRATCFDGDLSVSLDFEFAANGEIVSAYTTGRPRAAADGKFELLPWGGRYRRYEEHGGIRIPVESEVFWVVNGKEQPYFRGINLAIGYEYIVE